MTAEIDGCLRAAFFLLMALHPLCNAILQPLLDFSRQPRNPAPKSNRPREFAFANGLVDGASAPGGFSHDAPKVPKHARRCACRFPAFWLCGVGGDGVTWSGFRCTFHDALPLTMNEIQPQGRRSGLIFYLP